MRAIRIARTVVGLTCLLISTSIGSAQVFPPRQPQPAPQPVQPFSEQPGQPQPSGTPGVISRTIPFSMILGDPTKSYIQIRNLPNPLDTNFILGRGLAGPIPLERYSSEAGNGQRSYVHLIGSSNPPIVTTVGAEIRYQFVFPTLLLKTFYKDYTPDGDSAFNDLVAEKLLVDVFVLPTLDQRQLPTFHSIRVAVTGSVKEAEKCTYFFDIIFPVNICKIAEEYLHQMQPALENGIRDILMRPQTRNQFENLVYQYLRWELLSKAGINPNSQAQFEIVRAEFRGTDYVVDYIPRQ